MKSPARQHPWFHQPFAALLVGLIVGLAHSPSVLAQPTTDTVWFEDSVPAGATATGDVEGWTWISSNPTPYAGSLAHQSAIVAGVHQHYFTGATATLPVKVGDTLFAYVYLDPANPPSEVMLQWNDGSTLSWNHRAYWGANHIGFGTDGTVSRRYMGPLPPTGQWVRLSVPAELVGLEGTTLSGASFVLFNGRATWDRSGKTSRNEFTVSGTITTGAAGVAGVAVTGTGNASCSPSDALGAYSCTVPYGWSGTITPQLNGYSLVPASRAYANVTNGTVAENYTVAAAIDISPKAIALPPSGSSQFAASVINSAASTVWAVDGIVGGNTTVGTISTTGLYVAPASTGSHTITATLSGTGIASSASVGVNNYRGVYTFHNDNARTGANQAETVLSPANVTAAQFGKLSSFPVDGEIYAQPLYVANVAIPGQGLRNVVYVATENNSVYAFDATGARTTPFWHVNFLTGGATTVSPADVASDAFLYEIGITGTPVIDPATSTIYLVALTFESGRYVHRLHALDLATGLAKFGGPVIVTGSFPGTATSSKNGRVPFIPFRHLQRSALLLMNNVVYVAFASHGDNAPYHGWMMGYDAQSLKQVAVYNVAPDGALGGIWMGAGGPAADPSNNVYVSTGNGTFTGNTGGRDLGDSFVKLGTAGRTFTVADYFTPFDEAALAVVDHDLGAGGITLFTGSSGEPLLVGIGKNGKVYVVNRNSMGKYHAGNDSQIVQSFQSVATLYINMPAFWQNNLYIVPSSRGSGGGAQYRYSAGAFGTTPVARMTTAFGFPGGVPSISSNGASNGIMWMLQADGWRTALPAVLRAYDANNIAVELYNSSQVPSRDTLGPAIKFSTPTIVDGKVFAGTGSSLEIFGLLAGATTYQISGTVSGAVASGVAFAATAGASCSNSDGAGNYSCTVPANWTGTVTPARSGYVFAPSSRSYANVSANQTAQNYVSTASADTVWVEDAVPAGATSAGTGESWNWTSANPAPFSGALAHQSTIASGLHQHYFFGATATLPVAVGDTLFAYVYLDPANPPSELMVQWDTGDGTWAHRAYWGANLIPYGTDGTASRRSMGALPATGQWVRLAVPASQVGLEGTTLRGMAFTLYNGRATWDRAGKSGTAPVTHQLSGAVSGAVVSGVTFAATSGATCSTSDAGGNYACTVPQGWSGTVTPSRSGFTFTPSSRAYASVVANQSAQNYVASGTASAAWVDDAIPAGATAVGELDGWNWISANPAPFSGALAHQSALLAGVHQHYFTGATTTMPVAVGDTLFAYVYLDAANPPSEVMLQWNDGAWNYRAYWGANLIPWGTDGTNSRRYVGPLPAAGQWVRLAVPASQVGLEGRTVSGMAFTLYNGRATWDYAGTTSGTATYQVTGAVTGAVTSGVSFTATGGASCTPSDPAGNYACTVPPNWSGSVTPALSGYTFSPSSRSYSNVVANQAAQDYVAAVSGFTVWSDDIVPPGAVAVGDLDGWNWVSANPSPYSGVRAHQSALLAGTHQHYFEGATSTLPVAVGDALFAYVYLDPVNPPSQVMLQWKSGTWEHRAYWGANLIPFGADGTASRRYMGPLPATGQWVRLSVPAKQVGLEGSTVDGMAFTLYDGRATWDYVGKYRVWVDDAVPAGATATGTAEGWNWIGSNPAPYAGTLVHQSALLPGVHQHYFSGATNTLPVNAGDMLFAYVYLDPANPPSEVMLQWDTGDGTWAHRAYWGANLIAWGTDGTASRRSMGALPATGQWLRLSVPASQVGLEGTVVSGMAFTLYNGRATWDYAGK